VRAFLRLLAMIVASAAPAQERVRAQDYDAFWLWAGVRARPEVETAKTVYQLQGEIGPGTRDGAIRMKAQGGGGPAPHAATLWLVYRVRSLDWPPEIVAEIVRRLALWRAAPGPVAGVEIDFDASTRRLADYADFLRALRAKLPNDCKLGVTGLMDWASQAAPEDLDKLASVVDEIVFQTYRGRDTVADIDAYMARIGRVLVPFKLGLSEDALWSAPAALADNKYFQGYVVFLRNRE
jgi:hypothetical protein